MTREEQIDTAASRRANQYFHPVEWNEAYCKFREGAKWADSHPDWHKASEELPPRDSECANKFSKKVLVSDGERITISRYDYEMDGWIVIDMEVTHWMYLPEPPKED